jgi:hypothetical protein
MQEEELKSFLGHIKLMLSSLDFLGRASKIKIKILPQILED